MKTYYFIRLFVFYYSALSYFLFDCKYYKSKKQLVRAELLRYGVQNDEARFHLIWVTSGLTLGFQYYDNGSLLSDFIATVT